MITEFEEYSKSYYVYKQLKLKKIANVEQNVEN